jgi:hypothetical protein
MNFLVDICFVFFLTNIFMQCLFSLNKIFTLCGYLMDMVVLHKMDI